MMPRLLSAGVDTLNLWFSWAESYDLPQAFTTTLTNLLEQFRANGRREPVFVPLLEFAAIFNPFLPAGEIPVFEVARVSGDKHYAWALVFGQDALTIKFSRPKDSIKRLDYAQVFVEINARYISAAALEIGELVTRLVTALESIVGASVRMKRINRVDQRADLGSLNPLFTLSDLERFVTFARSKSVYQESPEPTPPSLSNRGGALYTSPTTGMAAHGAPDASTLPDAVTVAHMSGQQWSGFTFGRGDLLARVYSKTLEARSKPLARDLLAAYPLVRACDLKTKKEFDVEHVSRVEFQVRSDVLKTFVSSDGERLDLRDWDTFLEHQSKLWAYLCEWLSLRDVNLKDTNRHRWAVSSVWEVVRGAFGAAARLERVKVGQALASQLMQQAYGCIVSAAANLSGAFSNPAMYKHCRALWAAVGFSYGSHATPKHIQNRGEFGQYLKGRLNRQLGAVSASMVT
jgi:hypothetical protein